MMTMTIKMQIVRRKDSVARSRLRHVIRPESCFFLFRCLFLPLHAIAMERYCHRMTSVRLSVTLVSADHICWATWNFITRLIRPVSSLVVRKISAI